MLSQQRQNVLIQFFKKDLHIYPDVTQIRSSQTLSVCTNIQNLEYVEHILCNKNRLSQAVGLSPKLFWSRIISQKVHVKIFATLELESVGSTCRIFLRWRRRRKVRDVNNVYVSKHGKDNSGFSDISTFPLESTIVASWSSQPSLFWATRKAVFSRARWN